ncbi:MAG: type II toxin-antitoxin system Phd/YefM family antitoxin [Bacteroidia bacterium]|nr:type II toxin-antitoxin system Phd/YefM family antitoxin [Bacteroidia bacterium]
MFVISSREFRDNQKMYLDKIDAGAEILLQRGKTKTYRIIRVDEDDTVVKKEHILAPDSDLTSAITAEELLDRLLPRIEEMLAK